jgi:hypothetical protein
MNVMTLMGVLMGVCAGQLPEIQPPPMPDFKQPVDYLAWYDAQLKYAAGDNALDMYWDFLYGNDMGAAPTNAPTAESKAADQLYALLESPEPWFPDQRQELAQWTARIEAHYLAPLAAASSRKFYAMRREPDLKLLADIKTPALINGRAIGQMMFARAWRVINKTIYTDRLLDAARNNLMFARHMSFGGTLDEQFFALGHRAFVYEQLRSALPSNIYTLEFWKSMLEVLDQFDDRPATDSYARSLYFAEASALQLLQHFCTEVDSNGVISVAPRVSSSAVEAFYSDKSGRARFRPPGTNLLAGSNPVELARTIHEYYESMRALLKESNVPDLTRKVRAIERETLGANPALESMVAPLGLTIQSVYSIEASRRMTRLYLNMAIMFKTTDQWPMTLDEVKAPDLATLRIDPFTGRDFLIQPMGTRTALYSVGPNGVDDGAEPGKDIVYWAMVAKQVDPLELPTGKDTPDTATEGGEGKKPATAASPTPTPEAAGSGK